MKKSIIIVLTVLLFSTVSYSQNSYQIDSTSKWIQQEIWAASSAWDVWNYSLTFQGDTIINDTVFHKMFLNGQNRWDDHGGSSYTNFTNKYFGAANESSGKISFVSPDSIMSIPLYDFNYSINDTIKTVIGNGLQIIDIDTLYDGRKKFITNSTDHLNILEGIGSNKGFYFTFAEYHAPYFIDTTLGCYYQNDSLIFLSDSTVCNFNLVVDISLNPETSSAYLFPVPAKNNLKIHIEEPVTSMRVYDFNCQIIDVKLMSSHLVDISSLKNGIYIMIINDKYPLKFIKN